LICRASGRKTGFHFYWTRSRRRPRQRAEVKEHVVDTVMNFWVDLREYDKLCSSVLKS
jgi:hypothetical protein